MEKKLIVLVSIVFLSPILCMDDPTPKKTNDKKNPALQNFPQIDDTNLIKQLASDGVTVGKDVIVTIEDEKAHKPIPIQTLVSDVEHFGQDVVQIIDDIKQPKQAVPNINLTDVPKASGSPTGSSKQPKTPISNVQDLGKKITSVQNTQRTSRAAATPSSTITRTKKSFLPNAVSNLTGQINLDKKTYTEEEVRELVKAVSPALHEFSEKYNLGLDELEEFAILLHEFDISPQVLTEYLHVGSDGPKQNLLSKVLAYVFGDPHQQNLENQHARYEKIKQGDPELYKTLVLDLLRKINDRQTKGEQAAPSTLTSTHTALQDQTISDQKSQIQAQYVGLFFATFLAIVQIVIPILQSNGIIPVHNNTN